MMQIRQFDPATDVERVEELERLCEFGPSGSISVFSDSLGNPMARVSNFPVHTMLVAEIGDEIVGVIRAGIKEMVCGRKRLRGAESPIVGRGAYILGLRVSPLHRRKGIALELCTRIETWCREQGASVAYMATEKSNTASSRLFIEKLRFTPARTPSILVHPVFQHPEHIPSHIQISEVPAAEAAAIYAASRAAASDFFPADTAAILASPLCAGTFLATLSRESRHVIPRGTAGCTAGGTPIRKLLGGDALTSWALCSVWRTDQVFKLRVGGAPWRVRALAAVSRAVDRAVPWLRITSFPDVFRPFGINVVFGIVAHGPRAEELVAALWRHAMNVARGSGCAVIAAEVGSSDPLLRAVPHWRSLSCMDDLWCVKRLQEKPDYCASEDEEWITDCPLDSAVFVDPRDV